MVAQQLGPLQDRPLELPEYRGAYTKLKLDISRAFFPFQDWSSGSSLPSLNGIGNGSETALLNIDVRIYIPPTGSGSESSSVAGLSLLRLEVYRLKLRGS